MKAIKRPNKNLITACLIIILLMQLSCNTTEPPDPPPPPPPVVEEPILTLELDDAHCTEAWINLKTEKLTLPAELTFKQFNPSGDSVIQNISLNIADTLLYIDSLLPNQTYGYQVSCIWHPAADSQKQALSNKLSVTTMDTTSHNFTFEMITFGGEIGSSVLYDVAIIDENNIWAVGYIFISDTSQEGYTNYNAIHWNGTYWELLRIPHYDYGGYLIYGPIQTVLAFSENDIWFCSPANLINYDGNTYDSKAFFMTDINFSGQVQKMWGTGGNNIYCVGKSGSIYHYYGTGWNKIPSNTTLNINDIWGDFNEKIQQWEILAVAGNVLQGTENSILEIYNNISTNISNASISWPLRSLWFNSGSNYFVAGSGIYQKHSLEDNIWLNDIYSITTYSINRIRASAINNVIATGGAGEIIHYNGYSWKSFIENTQLISGNYYSCDIKGNKIIAVGQNNPRAVITIGTR